MSIPFIDFSEQYQLVKDEIHTGLDKVFQKGDYILGEAAKNFENNFASYCGVKHGIGVNSGTDALYLAIAALGIQEGDEVILPTFTFIATALCVSYAGATPVKAAPRPRPVVQVRVVEAPPPPAALPPPPEKKEVEMIRGDKRVVETLGLERTRN